MQIMFTPIGVIHSPFIQKGDIQQEKYWNPEGFDPVHGELEVFPEYAPGLDHIEGFSHLIVLFVFHAAEPGKLTACPPCETQTKGVFATRSPRRPNPLGITVVRLMERKENILKIAGVDMIEGTPVLDIKPYTPRDNKTEARFGWLEAACR